MRRPPVDTLRGELRPEQPPFRSDRDTGTTWIVVDFVDVVVHLFEPEQREYYDLESLWADGTPVEVPAPVRAAG